MGLNFKTPLQQGSKDRQLVQEFQNWFGPGSVREFQILVRHGPRFLDIFGLGPGPTGFGTRIPDTYASLMPIIVSDHHVYGAHWMK